MRLHQAAAVGDLAFVQALLRENHAVNTTDEQVFTPLMWAAKQGHLQVVNALLGFTAYPAQTGNEIAKRL